jgi:hypothetical protein
VHGYKFIRGEGDIVVVRQVYIMKGVKRLLNLGTSLEFDVKIIYHL